MGIWEKKEGSWLPGNLTLFPPYRFSQIFLHKWNLTMEKRICRTWEEINFLGRGGKGRAKKSLPTDWSYCALFQETTNCFWCSSILPWRSQREQKGRGGRRREGRGKEEKGGERRKGVGRSCTHCVSVCWALTLLLGKKRSKLLVNAAAWCFAMAQDDKGRRSE